MEQSTLIKIARLRAMAARNGHPFDVVRFAGDPRFALETLTALMNTEDEALLVLGLELLDLLGLNPVAPVSKPTATRQATTATTAAAPERATADASAGPAADRARYVGRLR